MLILLTQYLEHGARYTRMIPHADPDDGDLGDLSVALHAGGPSSLAVSSSKARARR